MEKVIPLDSWDFGVEPVAVVKRSSHGLVNADRRELFEKRAAAPIFAGMIDKLAMSPGDIPIHTIAIGDTEHYGANRNGDAFCADTCRKQAHTFVSSPLGQWPNDSYRDNGARYYRHHQNRDPHKSYGYVKAAAYNDRMGRIELLIIANGTKEAAKRNGGLVLPDSTLQKLAGNELVSGSMSCFLPFDSCAICHHKSASPAEYCTESTCRDEHGEEGLGCRHNLTKIARSGRQQYVENPDAVFFDFSEVARPADRTAYGGRADYLLKAASAGNVLGGASLAAMYAAENGTSLPWLGPDTTSHMMKLAGELATLEKACESNYEQFAAGLDQMLPQDDAAIDWSQLAGATGSQQDTGLKHASEHGILLSPHAFLQLRFSESDSDKVAKLAAAVMPCLPGVYSRLAAAADLPSRLEKNAAWLTSEGVASRQQRELVKAASASYSCQIPAALERAQRAILRGKCKQSACRPRTFSPTTLPGCRPLAEDYAIYKLAFLAAQPKCRDLTLTQKLVCLQNYA